jgi:hypothetical protein
LETAFLALASFDILPKSMLSMGKEYAQTGVLLLLVHILIFANTLIFIFDSQPIMSPLHLLDGLDGACRRGLLGKYRAAITLLGLSVIVAAVLGVIVVINLWDEHARLDAWASVLSWNEWMFVFIYGAFLGADLLCLSATGTVLAGGCLHNRTQRARVVRFQKTVKLFTYGCDGPGLIGIVLILISGTWLHSMAPNIYWHGLVAGAIGMHILFSQTAVALLSVFDGD